MNNIQDKIAVRILMRAREDFQAQRKRMDNRIGRKADGSDQKIDERSFRDDDLQSFIEVAEAARKQEEDLEKRLAKALKRFPIWTEWLQQVNGVGTIAGATIVGSFDIEEATTVSKMWQYAGMNPGMVRGKKRKEKKDGTFDVIVTDTMVRGDRLTAGFISPFNKRLRTALCGVLADGFIKDGIRWNPIPEDEYEVTPEYMRSRREKKIGDTKHKDVPCRMSISSKYAQLYVDYKHRLANSSKETTEIKSKGGKPEQVKWKDATPGHRDRAAKRYMVKIFLQDLYNIWRDLEGLEVRPPYQEEYLGHKHSA